MINKYRVNSKHDNKAKNLPTFSILQRPIRKDYTIYSTKMIFNLL